MRRTNYKLYVIFLVIIVFMLGVVSLVYATLQTNLNIGFKSVTQSGIKFNVGFDTTAVVGTSANGATCPTITPTANSINISGVQLGEKYDATCLYKFTIKNTGNVNAKVLKIQTTFPTGETCTVDQSSNMVCGHLKYDLRYNEGLANFTAGKTIPASSNVQIMLKISSTDTSYASQAENSISQSGAGYTITFNMAE